MSSANSVNAAPSIVTKPNSPIKPETGSKSPPSSNPPSNHVPVGNVNSASVVKKGSTSGLSLGDYPKEDDNDKIVRSPTPSGAPPSTVNNGKPGVAKAGPGKTEVSQTVQDHYTNAANHLGPQTPEPSLDGLQQDLQHITKDRDQGLVDKDSSNHWIKQLEDRIHSFANKGNPAMPSDGGTPGGGNGSPGTPQLGGLATGPVNTGNPGSQLVDATQGNRPVGPQGTPPGNGNTQLGGLATGPVNTGNPGSQLVDATQGNRPVGPQGTPPGNGNTQLGGLATGPVNTGNPGSQLVDATQGNRPVGPQGTPPGNGNTQLGGLATGPVNTGNPGSQLVDATQGNRPVGPQGTPPGNGNTQLGGLATGPVNTGNPGSQLVDATQGNKPVGYVGPQGTPVQFPSSVTNAQVGDHLINIDKHTAGQEASLNGLQTDYNNLERAVNDKQISAQDAKPYFDKIASAYQKNTPDDVKKLLSSAHAAAQSSTEVGELQGYKNDIGKAVSEGRLPKEHAQAYLNNIEAAAKKLGAEQLYSRP